MTQFGNSLKLYPTRAALKNVVLCLERLGRFDEALETLEQLMVRYAQWTRQERADYEAKVAELSRHLGIVELRGLDSACRVIVDERDLGTAPLPSPLRLVEGVHRVRITRPGAPPTEEVLQVVAGERTVVRIGAHPSAPTGRLSIRESSGRTLRLKVDGVILGMTPWSGEVAAGDHVLTLEGDDGYAAPPTTIAVRAAETTSLTIPAERRPSQRENELTGRLGPSANRGVVLGIEAAGALTLAGLGGDVSSCSGECRSGLGWGGRVLLDVGYRLGSHWVISAQAGYLRVTQQVTNRQTTMFAVQTIADEARVTDDLTLSGEMLGMALEYRIPYRIDSSVRIGAGALLGGLRDQRTGAFTTQERVGSASATYPLSSMSQRPPAEYGYLSLLLEAALRPTTTMRLGLGIDISALVAFRQPSWSRQALFPTKEGVSWFAEERLSGQILVFFCPQVRGQYDF